MLRQPTAACLAFYLQRIEQDRRSCYVPTKIPDQLRQVAEHISQGGERSETVRALLSWFEAERRGYWKVHEIRKALRKVKLKTEPDFEDAWIDASIVFVTKTKK